MPLVDSTRFDRDYSTYTLQPQVYPPSCVIPPAPCTLKLTGTTAVVNVTLRGDDDGSITVYWSGSTGTTSCYINGVLDGTEAGNSHAFTGLTAGYYNILIEEGDCFDTQNNIQVVDGEFRTGSFIVNTPVSLSAVENPIILNLRTAFNTGGASYSKFNINVNSTVSDGQNLVFTFTYPQAYSATFYAKSFPNRGNYFLASVLKDGAGNTVGNNTTTEIATSIAEVLSNDSVISRLYWISANGATVTLTAKEANTKLDGSTVMTFNAALAITGQQLAYGNAQFDGAITENYSLYADILVNTQLQYGENPSTFNFNKATQLELPFNPVSNSHYFDLSTVLKNFVSTPKLDFTLTGYTTIADMLCGYQVQYGEKYPLVPNSTTKKSRVKGTTSTLYALNSALAWEDINDLTTYLGNRLHNVKANFDGTVTNTGSTYSLVTITDYLWDTGSTETTNIGFRFTDTVSTTDSGWITGNTYSFTTTTHHSGKIYISGSTSGVTFQYTKDWYGYPSASVGDIQGFNQEPNIQHEVKFLTNSPNPKFVQRDSSEFLYCALQKDYGKTLKIKGDLYFYDGTSLTGQTLYTVSTGSTNYGGIFMFAAGYNELGLASYETYSGGTRKIRRVDFALYQNDTENGDYLLSEEKSYRYEIDEQPRRFGVAFMNKFGCYDIFDFSGEIVDTASHTNQLMEVPREVGLGGNSPLGFEANSVYGTAVLRRHECNTGWIDEAHFNWLIELLSSNKIYNYTDAAQPFLIKESVNYKKSSNDDLYQIDVVFVETLAENNVKV
jgi:hypothetical protein